MGDYRTGINMTTVTEKKKNNRRIIATIIFVVAVILIVQILFKLAYNRITLKTSITCSSFLNHAQAQSAFERDPQGLKKLDHDKDGIACESLK
jgi:hypothetical protein